MPYSYVNKTGDGSAVLHSIPFPFISRDHVFVKVNGVATSAFTWINDGQIEFDTAASAGYAIRISRVTPLEPLVDFADGATLTERDLDLLALQSSYIVQDLHDRVSEVVNFGDAPLFSATDGMRYGTRAAAIAASIPVAVTSIYVAGYRTVGDGGGGVYVRAAFDPGHLAVLTSTDGSLWVLDRACLNPEHLGAYGDGSTDDIDALDALADWQEITGGGIELRGGREYAISRAWEFAYNNISVTSKSGPGHNQGRAVIQKLPTFSGVGGLVVTNGCSGVYLAGVYVNGGDFVEPDGPGDYGVGHGIFIGICDNVNIERCQAQNNADYGFVFDGIWVLNTHMCVSRFNGTYDADTGVKTGGGLLYDNTTRENANHEHGPWLMNGNAGHDVYSNDGGTNILRANAIHWHGGQFESGGDDVIANWEIVSGTRWMTFGTQWAQSSGSAAYNIIIGSVDPSVGAVVTIQFHGGYWQHNVAGPGWAVLLGNNIVSAEWFGPDTTDILSKFINAENADVLNTIGGRPKVVVHGGDAPSANYRDPNSVVSVIGGEGITAGLKAAGLGDNAHFGSQVPGIKVRLETLDAGGGVHYAQLGLGTNENIMHLGDLFLSIAPLDAEPAITGLEAGQAIFACADGDSVDGWDPLGLANDPAAEYLVWTPNGGINWFAFGAPAIIPV
jgi:hypothetical protein